MDSAVVLSVGGGGDNGLASVEAGVAGGSCGWCVGGITGVWCEVVGEV